MAGRGSPGPDEFCGCRPLTGGTRFLILERVARTSSSAGRRHPWKLNRLVNREPTLPATADRTPFGGATPRRAWRDKFRDAFRGVAVGLRGQNSFLIHVLASAAVVAAGFFFRVTLLEWGVLVLCIVSVFVAELLNTSLEWLAKAIREEHDPRIGSALDVASAAVLLAAFGAMAVGFLVFLPHLIRMVSGLLG
jgi:diacylglycerol kinase